MYMDVVICVLHMLHRALWLLCGCLLSFLGHTRAPLHHCWCCLPQTRLISYCGFLAAPPNGCVCVCGGGGGGGVGVGGYVGVWVCGCVRACV